MWDPFRDFDSLLGRMAGFSSGMGPGFTSSCKGAWVPHVDLREKDKSYVITADLPGMKRSDVKVEMDGNRVCLSGVRRKDDDGKADDLLIFSERRSGPFERCFELPQPIKENNTTASFRDNVLTVVVDKEKESTGRVSRSVRIDE